jgi:hypothetical protein
MALLTITLVAVLKGGSLSWLSVLGEVVTEICGAVMFKYYQSVHKQAGELWQMLEKTRQDEHAMRNIDSYVEKLADPSERNDMYKKVLDAFLKRLANGG